MQTFAVFKCTYIRFLVLIKNADLNPILLVIPLLAYSSYPDVVLDWAPQVPV